ncbi:MAG: hypothetical protein HMLKMBBP_01837 [Planctomycetes bacterium]|nr:hypothetical protein [Planctomycetota bacterium]
MRGFLRLVGRELREVRALAWVLAALPVAAVLLVRWTMDVLWQNDWAPASQRPRWHAMTVVLCAAMSSAAVACDMFGRERSNGTLDQILALPVRRATLWAAKAASWLLLTAALFAVGAGAQAWHLMAKDGTSWTVRWAEEALRSAPIGGAIVGGTGAAVLLVSTLGLRGLASLLVGSALAAGWTIGTARPVLALAPQVELLWLSLSLAAALVASLAAFTLGRAWLGRWVRATVVAVAAVLLVAVAPVYAAVRHAIAVTPDRGILQDLVVRPDGRFAVGVWADGSVRFSSIHVVDLATGRTREAASGHAWLVVSGRPSPYARAGSDPWDADGRFVVLRADDGRVVRTAVDPATLEEELLGAFELDSAARRAEWDAWATRPRWQPGRNLRRTTDDDLRPWECTVRLRSGARDLGASVTLRSWQEVRTVGDDVVLWQPERGVFAARKLTKDACADAARDVILARADPRDGAQPPFFTVNGMTPDGSRVLVCADGSWSLASPDGASPIPLPEGAVAPALSLAYPAGLSGPEAFAAATTFVELHVGSTSAPRRLWDPATGRSIPVSGAFPLLSRLPDGSLIAAFASQNVIEHIAADLSAARIVREPKR